MAEKKQTKSKATATKRKSTDTAASKSKGKKMDGLEPGEERFVATGKSIVPLGRWMPEDGPEKLEEIKAKARKVAEPYIKGGVIMGGRGMGGGYAVNAPARAGGLGNRWGDTLEDDINQVRAMDDWELADWIRELNDPDLYPDFLNTKSGLQKMIYTTGENDKPTVVDDAQLKKDLKNDPSLIPLYRSCHDTKVNGVAWTADDCLDDFADSDLYWIGDGRIGDGSYFSSSFSGSRSYGHRTICGYIKPGSKVVTISQLRREWNSWSNSHPRAASALKNEAQSNGWGNAYGEFALLRGYDVVRDDGRTGKGVDRYYNVVNRSCMVISTTRRNGSI